MKLGTKSNISKLYFDKESGKKKFIYTFHITKVLFFEEVFASSHGRSRVKKAT